MNTARLHTLQEKMQAAHIDAAALLPGPNLLYISGIHAHLSERPLVLFIPAHGRPAVVIPTLEADKARAAGLHTDHIFAWNDGDGFTAAFQHALTHLQLDGATLAAEKLTMRLLEWDTITQFAPRIQKQYLDPLINDMRLQKDAAEIEQMARAVAVAETGMEHLLPHITVGRTEKEIAAHLSSLLLQAGGDKLSFDPIVAAGPNAASPHAVPTARPLAEGDLLIIDWGVIVNDYPSDLTRTFAVGDVTDEQTRIYDAVLRANRAGVAAVTPGATCGDVDDAARQAITAAGYGDAFIHRTGHGLGLEVHEPPNIMGGNQTVLRPGMTFTVEPGIYIPRLGGVRIEDNMVVTAEGGRSLSTFTRELIHVG